MLLRHKIFLSPLPRIARMSSTRWFDDPQKGREMSLSDSTYSPSTSTSIESSISSVASQCARPPFRRSLS